MTHPSQSSSHFSFEQGVPLGQICRLPGENPFLDLAQLADESISLDSLVIGSDHPLTWLHATPTGTPSLGVEIDACERPAGISLPGVDGSSSGQVKSSEAATQFSERSFSNSESCWTVSLSEGEVAVTIGGIEPAPAPNVTQQCTGVSANALTAIQRDNLPFVAFDSFINERRKWMSKAAASDQPSWGSKAVARPKGRVVSGEELWSNPPIVHRSACQELPQIHFCSTSRSPISASSAPTLEQLPFPEAPCDLSESNDPWVTSENVDPWALLADDDDDDDDDFGADEDLGTVPDERTATPVCLMIPDVPDERTPVALSSLRPPASESAVAAPMAGFAQAQVTPSAPSGRLPVEGRTGLDSCIPEVKFQTRQAQRLQDKPDSCKPDSRLPGHHTQTNLQEFLGRRHAFHNETQQLGFVSDNGRQFFKKKFDGRLTLVTENSVHTGGVAKYMVQFSDGQMSGADGVGFVFSSKLPCTQNIQLISSVFVNKGGCICLRSGAELVRSTVSVKCLEVGDWIGMTVDLDKRVVEFVIFPAKGRSSPSKSIFDFGTAFRSMGDRMPALPSTLSGYLTCVVKNTGVELTIGS